MFWRPCVLSQRSASSRALSGHVLFLPGLLGPEHLAHLVEEGLRLRIRVLPRDGGELLEQLRCLRVSFSGTSTVMRTC